MSLKTRDGLFDLPEVELLARLVDLEAGGESLTGQAAVACVVTNRAKKGGWYGSTVKDVALKPYQFSCFNDGPGGLLQRALNEPARVSTHTVAQMALLGLVRDPTGGATHYHEQSISPKWSQVMERTVQIGRHIFYRERVKAAA